MHNDQLILLVDDEKEFLSTARLILLSAGISSVETLDDSRCIMDRVAMNRPSLIVLDLTMPHQDGRECLSLIQQNYPEIPVVILTGLSDLENAVWCMRNGAADYITKPIREDEFLKSVQRILEQQSVVLERNVLRESLLSRELKYPQVFNAIVTKSPIMKNIFTYAEAISRTRMPVLVTGETGAGKELLVKALHTLSSPDAPFVSVNVAGLDEQMFADTLFGHLKGAYTGATNAREGVIERANGGTLFLDEIGDLKPDSQIKLLRLIQENEYYPIGSDTPCKANVWIITATNVEIGNSPNFRKDLYYRLKTHRIDLPSLRERSEDIPLLIRHFSRTAAEKIGLPETWNLPESIVSALSQMDYPGNVRELQGVIYDLVGCTESDGTISKSVLLRYLPNSEIEESSSSAVTIMPDQWETLPTLKQMEQLLIREALARTGHNKSAAAALLGVTRQTIARWNDD